MALFNSFKFGDVDSKDYGVYISGDSVYDSPARSVDLVQVPGRNGALALDNGYYENIEVTYPAGSFGTSQEEWREKMLGIRNALAAQKGYQKLIDTYHPEHYRLGMFFAGISASPVQYNRAGQFPIRFNCKPQRFLISGDEAVEFTAEGQEEVYGPASIVSFEAEEGAEIRQLEVDLEPIQNLNGYDNPWPAGGGKNLCPNILQGTDYRGVTVSIVGDKFKFSGTATSTGGRISLYTEAFTLPAGTYVLSSDYNYGASPSIQMIVQNASTNAVIKDCQNVGSFTLSEDTSVRVGFNVVSGNTYNNTVYIQIEAGSTVTAYAPYENICPISGWTGTNITRAGGNLFDSDLLLDATGWEKNNTIYSGSSRNLYDKYKLSAGGFPIAFKENEQYTLSFTAYQSASTVNDGYRFLFSYTDGTTSALGGKSTTPASYTLTSELGKTIDKIAFTYSSSSDAIYLSNIMLAPGATAKPYEPFKALDQISISLNQTVYGGTLNVTTGELTVDRAMVDMGTLTYSYSSSYGYMITTGIQNAVKRPAANTDLANIVCSNYATITASQAANGAAVGAGIQTNGRIIIYDPAYTDAAAFKTAMNGVQLVYELITPTTVQLTPTQVSTLLGQNIIFADSGEVEVKVASPVDLTNPTNFPAKPLIRIYGNGSVRVGDTIATVQNNADGYVDIDCESMNCYDTTGGRNADVSFSGNDFPELASGDNGILLTGPSKVEITPRWWEL